MASKAHPLQSGLLALFMLIPLFRPIVVAHNRIILVYGIFALAFLVLLANINITRFSPSKPAWFLLIYTIISIVSSLSAISEIRIDYIGLLCFLPISYFLGLWLGKSGSTHTFFRVMAAVFIPIAIYVIYQLSKSSFSYNTYYYWSAAAYKIDYLTTSLYAVVILIYFFFNSGNIIEKYGLPLFCFGFVAISGARYSIVFAAIVGIYILYSSAKNSPIKLVLGFIISSVLLLSLVMLNKSVISGSSDLITYSLFRLENMFGDDTSVEGRLVLMQKASEVITKYFFFGVGVAGSGDALASNYPHNLLLEAFIDGGFFSALPLLAFLFSSVYLVIKSKHQHKAWCVLLVLYLLGAFLKSFSIYESRILFFFLGYAATLKFYNLPENINRSQKIAIN